jgi:oligopeptide transport system substrate-binding protein
MAAALFALAACNPHPYPGEEGTMLHVGLRQLPKTFDPPDIGNNADGKIASHVFDGLLAYHPYARPYQLEPALAAQMPEVSEDGRTYTFRLRKGVTYVDDPCFPGGKGREVVAADVAFVFARFAHPTTHAKGWWLLDGRIAGMNAWRESTRAAVDAARERGQTPGPVFGIERPIEGVQVVDRYTVRFHLTEPYPQFLWTLAMPYLSVYPPEAVHHYGDAMQTHPVGTGPFKVVEFNPVYRVVYEANPGFREVRVPDPAGDPSQRYVGWEEDVASGLLAHAGERLPLVDGIESRFILEDQPRWLYFKAGYTDFLNPPKDNVREAIPNGRISEQMKARGVRLTPWPELGTVYTALNNDDPVTGNLGLRRALALAFDHAWTIDNLYSGQAIMATSLLPPGIAGYDPDYHPYHSDDGKADVERARTMLADAGYPGGVDPSTGRALRLTFESSGTGTTQRHFANRFTDEMRRLGIEVDVVVNTFPQLTEKMRNKQYQVAGLAWGFDYPDAQNILQLLYGPNAAPGSNRTNFRNERFDELYRRAATLTDGVERAELYRQMARIVSDEVPWITRTHRIRPNLQQPWLQGFKYTEVTYHNWRYVAVDAAMRERLLAEWNRPTRWPLAVLGALMLGLLGITVVRGRS